MDIRRGTVGAAVLALFLCALGWAAPVAASGDGLLLAQGQPMMQGQQGGMRQQGGMPQGQQGGQGGSDACMQSYQRCVMMCAGVGNCVNNCNIGYAVCTQQGGKGGGS